MKKFLLFTLLFIIAVIGIAYLWLHQITSATIIPRPKEQAKTFHTVSERLAANVPVDIALLGYAGGRHDGPYLTDSILLAHIDPKMQKIFVVSIPRDIWVKLPITEEGTYMKINAAYAIGMDDTGYPNKPTLYSGTSGGGKLAEKVISDVTGIQTDYFVGIDFSGFTKTIDTLGGVDVTVDTAFDDYAYPLENITDTSCGHSDTDIKAFTATVSAEHQLWDYFPCRYEHLHFEAGTVHMDGVTALKYVRSRHSLQDGSDFGRAKRQRNLLLAVKQKVLSVGFIPHLIPFMTSLGADVRTDLTLNDITSLVQLARSLNNYTIIPLALTDKNYLIETFSSSGQDILQPKEGLDKWTNIHAWIADAFAGKKEPDSAIVLVKNGTHTVGLAQTVAQKLDNAGLVTLTPKNADSKDYTATKVMIYTDNLNPTDLAIIRKEFRDSSIVTEKSATSSAFNVLVILGADYISKPETRAK